jgi:hypothetical protein
MIDKFDKYNSNIIIEFIMSEFKKIFEIDSYSEEIFIPFTEIKIFLIFNKLFETFYIQIKLLYSLTEKYDIYVSIENCEESKNVINLRIPERSYKKILAAAKSKKFNL